MLCWCNQMNVSLILNRSECTMAAADPQFKYVLKMVCSFKANVKECGLRLLL